MKAMPCATSSDRSLGRTARVFAAAMIGLLASAGFSTAEAQAFPSRPLSLVVPSAPGDPADSMARLLAPKMAERLGQPVLIENRQGASMQIGSAYVAKSPPDGHTMLVALSAHVVNQVAFKNLPYDTLRDFSAVSLLARQPLCIAANASVKGANLREFIQAAKAQPPGTLNFGSIGTGTLLYLVVEEINRRSDLGMVHVAFKGGGPVLQAVLANEIQVVALFPGFVSPHFRSGKLKPLAVTSSQRLRDLRDVPTVAESGFPGFEANNWVGVFVPSATPGAVVSRLNAELTTALNDVRDKVVAAGFEVVASTPQELDRFVRAETEHWANFAREFNMQFE